MELPSNEPLAVEVKRAIQTGDVPALKRLLEQNPELSVTWVVDSGKKPGTGRSLLHIVTDWPGHFPNGVETVRALVAAGADVNARVTGSFHTETPLHWAASCDDVAVLDALLDAGADFEAPGAVLGGGTPLADAVGFGQWNAARRLVERGARTTLPQAAALGLMDRVAEHFARDPAPTQLEVSCALWYACHGNQRPAAEFLLARGADVNWIPSWEKQTALDIAQRANATEVLDWLLEHGAKSASDLGT
jgi:uncharacterized protein